MREYEIWDNISPLKLGNGKLYDKDFLIKNFYIKENEKVFLIKENGRVIEVSPLSIYIDNMGIEETEDSKILDYIRENIDKEPEEPEETE